MAPSYISAIAIILAQLFPDVGIDAINTTINTLITVGLALYVGYRQLISGRSTLVGTRPE